MYLFKSFVYFFIFLFFLWLSFESSLYILDTNSLSDTWFAKIFPQPLTYLFVLLAVSFEEQTFSILMSPFCQFVLLWILVLVSDLRNLCLTQGHKDFSLLFSFRGFIVSGFTVRSVIYVALLFYLVQDTR